jgi:hypothetical protein
MSQKALWQVASGAKLYQLGCSSSSQAQSEPALALQL